MSIRSPTFGNSRKQMVHKRFEERLGLRLRFRIVRQEFLASIPRLVVREDLFQLGCPCDVTGIDISPSSSSPFPPSQT
ncbi:hypothetical protein EAG_09229 [Camponotus floridanus]|uniref:Uncharacterized protein n=1 Tax=Camponotus floridanus TaxID=104421 RepID=E2AL07_CAMFO|nr:hypothetical protein EAG_09229 [Camponotus floridanus]